MTEVPNPHMWVTFLGIVIAVTLFAVERIRLELSCIAIISGFMLFFYLFPFADQDGINLLGPDVLLAGLANPSLITILALLVVGQGLFQTGALEAPARTLSGLAGARPRFILTALLVSVGITSAFLNNTPVVVMFIPIVAALAAKSHISASKAMMPLSFICILGGMTTLIGSSTNLLVADVARQIGHRPIGFFDFFIPGAVLAAVGSIYVIFFLPARLTPRATMAEEVGDYHGKQYLAQITLSRDHPLVGSQASSGIFPSLAGMTVRMIQRGEHPFLPPFEDVVLEPGDIMIVAATRQVLTNALKDPNQLASMASIRAEGDIGPGADRHLLLVEAVIAPGSRMIGRSIEQSGIYADSGCIVLGLQRRSRMVRVPITEIRLEAGDVMLVIGSNDQIRRLRVHRDVLVMEWSASELLQTGLARRALGIFAAVVFLSALNILPVVIAAMLGALAMIPAGCLNVRQATRSFDQRIYLLVGASLAMAAPLEVTGGAHYLAHMLLAALSEMGSAVILSALFALIACLTNLLTNNATAVLFTPIAIGIANGLGVDPFPFIVAVILSSNCSFATPIAYQTNLLVMGPGHYRFTDFVKAGVPLVVLLWLTFSLFAPWYFGI